LYLDREEVRTPVTRVVAENGESVESLLRRFNKRVQSDRILSEVRRRRFFEKPSIVRKRKKAAKLRKSRRTTMKSQQRAG
jgi:small subunit ribosomal protein S21